MAGMAVTAPPGTRLYTNNGVSGGGTGTGTQSSQLTPSNLNEFRISAVIDRLTIHLFSNSTHEGEFQNLCHSLSRHSSSQSRLHLLWFLDNFQVYWELEFVWFLVCFYPPRVEIIIVFENSVEMYYLVHVSVVWGTYCGCWCRIYALCVSIQCSEGSLCIGCDCGRSFVTKKWSWLRSRHPPIDCIGLV